MLATLVFAGCAESNADSQALYIEAATYADKARQEASSYSEALVHYQGIQARINLILEDTSSQVALDLAAGKLPLGGLSLYDFQAKQSKIYGLAEAESNLTKSALKVAATIEDESAKEFETYNIYMAHLEEEGVAVIERFLEASDSLDKKFWAMTGLIKYHLNAGNLEEATDFLEQSFALAVDPENQRGSSASYRDIIIQVATSLEEAPQYPEILDRLAGALMNIEDPKDRYNVLVSLGRLSFLYGDRERSLVLLDEALASSDYVDRDTPYWGNDRDIEELLGAYLLARAPERAEKLIAFLSDEKSKSAAYQILSAYYGRSGEEDKAIAALSSAEDLARAWEVEVESELIASLQLWELASIAWHYASLGRIDKALALDEELDSEARRNEDWRKHYHAHHLASMVQQFMTANLTEEAARMYGVLVNFTQGTNIFFRMEGSQRYKVDALMIAVRAFSDPDNLSYSQRAFTQALRFTRDIESPSTQARRLSDLSLLLKEHPNLEPREQDWDLVRTIIQDRYPISNFWQ